MNKQKAALGNEKETYEAFNDYVRYVTTTVNRRLDVLLRKVPKVNSLYQDPST